MAPFFLKQILFLKSQAENQKFQSPFASISSHTNCGKSKPRESHSLNPKNTMRGSKFPFPRPHVGFSMDTNSCLFQKKSWTLFQGEISSLKISNKTFLPSFFFEICILEPLNTSSSIPWHSAFHPSWVWKQSSESLDFWISKASRKKSKCAAWSRNGQGKGTPALLTAYGIFQSLANLYSPKMQIFKFLYCFFFPCSESALFEFFPPTKSKLPNKSCWRYKWWT